MVKSDKKTLSTNIPAGASASISKPTTRVKKAKRPLPSLSVFSRTEKQKQGLWITIPRDNHKQQCLAAKRGQTIPAFQTTSGEKRVSARTLTNELATLDESPRTMPR